MSNRKAVITKAASLALVTVLSGCAQDPNTNPRTRVVTAGSVSVLMETEHYTGEVAGMGITGKLGIVGGKCVGFVSSSPRVLVLFPPGTTVTGDYPRDLIIHSGKADLHIGDNVDGGTRLNEEPRADLSKFGDLESQVPAPCRKFQALPVDGLRLTR